MNRTLSGLRDAIPIAGGYIPVAITFGLIVRGGGLSMLDAILASALVFAGAAQFLAIGMFIAGAGVLQIIVAGTLLNLRHLLMSSVIAERLDPGTSPLLRHVVAFGVTDEVFGIAGRRAATGASVEPRSLLGLEIGAYAAWVGGTAVGALVGDILPPAIQTAMGMALYALFAGLLAGIIRDVARGRPRLTMVITAITGAALNTVLRVWVGWDPGIAFPVAMIGAAMIPVLIDSSEVTR